MDFVHRMGEGLKMGKLGTRRTAITVALFLIGVLCLLPVSDAAAKKKKPKPINVQTATALSAATGDGGTASATANCPPKTVAIGGGFYAPFAFNQSIYFPTSSIRASNTSWQASGFVDTNGPGPTITLTVEAYCAKLPGQVVEASSSGTVQPSSFANGVVSCPGKSQLLSGGFTISSDVVPNYPFVFSNHRGGTNSWTADFATLTTQKSTTTRAYCFKKKKGKKKKKSKLPAPQTLTDLSATGSLAGSSMTQGVANVPVCPGKRRTLSGGWTAPIVALIPGSSVPVFFESRRVGGAWKVSAEQLGNSPGTFSGLAYCG